MTPSPKALTRFKERVRLITRRNSPVSMAQMAEDLAPTLRGWGNYYAVGNVDKIFYTLDCWIRDRMRYRAAGKATRLIRYKIKNKDLVALGLVSLVDLHQQRLSPA
jgi:RNA-directed DNA polymerase